MLEFEKQAEKELQEAEARLASCDVEVLTHALETALSMTEYFRKNP